MLKSAWGLSCLVLQELGVDAETLSHTQIKRPLRAFAPSIPLVLTMD